MFLSSDKIFSLHEQLREVGREKGARDSETINWKFNFFKCATSPLTIYDLFGAEYALQKGKKRKSLTLSAPFRFWPAQVYLGRSNWRLWNANWSFSAGALISQSVPQGCVRFGLGPGPGHPRVKSTPNWGQCRAHRSSSAD